MRARAICLCRDEGVCRVVETALGGTGVEVEHHAQVPTDPGEVALFVVDRETGTGAETDLRGLGAPVVLVGHDLEDDGMISLMLEAPFSHLVRDPGDRELGITSEKLVSGDLFGLEKYLAKGSGVGERVVGTDADKRAAMQEVLAWAEAIGARRPIVHRLATVIDELLMNALHDAPRESKPVLSIHDTGGIRKQAVLRWSADESTIAISVSDPFGALRQRDVIDHVRRARDERGRPVAATSDDPGAGLGLYLVLANVASLIVNVDPGRRTEVVCLFDRARPGHRAVTSGVRSLHVFQQH
jgi:anti-sigma regulatory factor (Ser/Thr protein kinase)